MKERIRSLHVGLEAIEVPMTLSAEEVALLLGPGRIARYEAARHSEKPSRQRGRRVVVPDLAQLALLGVTTPTP